MHLHPAMCHNQLDYWCKLGDLNVKHLHNKLDYWWKLGDSCHLNAVEGCIFRALCHHLQTTLLGFEVPLRGEGPCIKKHQIFGPCPHRDRDYHHIGSNFWKFYLIRTSFTLGEPVSLVKVFRLFRSEHIFFDIQSVDTVGRCTTSYLLAGPVCLWCLVCFEKGPAEKIERKKMKVIWPAGTRSSMKLEENQISL